VAAAVAGDVIQFDHGLKGIVSLSTDLAFGRSLTIRGNLDPTGNPLVILSRGGATTSTALTVGTGVTAAVSGLGFTGSTMHAVTNLGTLTLDDVLVSGNHLGDAYNRSRGAVVGGFGSVFNTGALTVTDSVIRDNQSVGYGSPVGGVGVYSTGTLTVMRTQLTNNVAVINPGDVSTIGSAAITHGGGVFNNGGAATLIDCTLTGNAAYTRGAVYSHVSKTLTLTRCTVTSNTAFNGGGVGVSGGVAGGHLHGQHDSRQHRSERGRRDVRRHQHWRAGGDPAGLKYADRFSVVGVPHTADLMTGAGGHSWAYFDHMAGPLFAFLAEAAGKQSRK
jgi:hypothetical protein